MISAVDKIAAMAPYALADLGPTGTISMAQNESAFRPSPSALHAGQQALAASELYPDPEWGALRTAIAKVHGLRRDDLLCGAGSMELIGALIAGFAGPGDEVLGCQYGYAYFATACQLSGTRYVTAPEPQLKVDPEEILPMVTGATKIVFVCNPGNPTGTVVANSALVRLRENLPIDVLLVIDQAYGEFCDPMDDPEVLFDLVARGNTVLTRSFSKAYALAGARVGWAYAPKAIGEQIRKILNPNNVSAVSQEMARAAVLDQEYLAELVRRTSELRDSFSDNCRVLGVQVPESGTNFALLRFASPMDAVRANEALRKNGLMARAMGGYDLHDCLRITICDRPVMERALAVLKEMEL
ncbi:MAG: pyridoxal phosphate-dependent aminotransferase [Paracoccaceae bacterium]